MVDNFNSIYTDKLTSNNGQTKGPANASAPTDGKDFQTTLKESIDEVNRLQAEADQAMSNLATGKTENVAEVFTAVKKAELAFQTLMQIRNKLMDAYDEIKQMKV